MKNYVDSDEAKEATKLRKRQVSEVLHLDSAPSKPVASNSGFCTLPMLIHIHQVTTKRQTVLGTPSERVVDNFRANGTAFLTVRCGSVELCVQECLYRGPGRTATRILLLVAEY